MNNDKDITNYCSDNSGWKSGLLAEMFLELIGSRELIVQLFKRNFKAKYRQTILGFLWALIMPVFTIGAFVFMNKAGILNIGKVDVPYPVFAILGLTIWHIFAGGLQSCSNALVEGGSMIVKINFPKETLVISAIADTLFEFLIRLFLTVIVFSFYKTTPCITTFLFPISLIPLVLLTFGIGLILSLFNAVFRDITNIVALLTTFLLFVTPVLYPETNTVSFGKIIMYNPITILINSPRELVLSGQLKQPFLFTIYSLISLLIFLAAWRLFHVAEIRIAERIGAR